MHYRARMSLVVAMLGLWTALSQSAVAQTRLGLHVTQEELTIWQARMTDTVNGVNGFTFQSIYQNRILADANTFVAQSHPTGDGYWAGYTGGGCVPEDDQSVTAGAGGTPFPKGNGAYMLRSAFTFLLTGTTAYATPVRTELLNQITVAGTDWANTAKWCYQQLGNANAIEIIPWLGRLVMAYDYLIAGGYTGFSAPEKTSILAWFSAAANVWSLAMLEMTAGTSYPGIYDDPPDVTCQNSCTTGETRLLYYNGPTQHDATFYTFFNQSTNIPYLLMAVGALTNNSTYIQQAAQYVTAFIYAGIWDNGAVPDYYRWQDGYCYPNCPQSMWGHTAGNIVPLVGIAEIYARLGNTSLYDLTVPTQVIGGSGSLVSLKKAILLYAQLANKQTQLYGTFDAGLVGPGTLLTWDNPTEGGGGDYGDFGAYVANLYFHEPTLHTALIRNSLSSNNSGGCRDHSQGGCFTGVVAAWADIPFMYGHLAGLVQPYTTMWTLCATENQTCSFSGTKQVRFGVEPYWSYRTITTSVVCETFVFGDPIFGQAKHCDVGTPTTPNLNVPQNFRILSTTP